MLQIIQSDLLSLFLWSESCPERLTTLLSVLFRGKMKNYGIDGKHRVYQCASFQWLEMSVYCHADPSTSTLKIFKFGNIPNAYFQ